MSFSEVFWCSVVLLILIIIVLSIVSRMHNNRAEQLRKDREFDLTKKLRDFYSNLFRCSPEELSGMPGDTEIGTDGKPKEVGSPGWGDKYTFYKPHSGYAYHRTKTCSSIYGLYPIHAVDVKNTMLVPCSKCNPVLPDLTWYSRYLSIKATLAKYEVNPTPYKGPSSDYLRAEAAEKQVRQLQSQISKLSSRVEYYKSLDLDKTIERNTYDKIRSYTETVLKKGLFRKTRVSYDFHTRLPIETNARLLKALQDDAEIVVPIHVSAKIKGSQAIPYDVSLDSCTCPDFKNTGQPCKHMYRLALELGMLLSIPTKDVNDALRRLSAAHARNQKELKRLDKH